MKDNFEQQLRQLYPPLPANTSQHCELSVAVVLAPSFTITPVAGFLDVLRLAADEADYSRQLSCRWTIVGDYAGEKITASCGMETTTWRAFDNPEQYDYVVVAGGRLPLSFELSAQGYEFIAQAHRRKVPLIALCVGSFLLAKLGLLDHKKCAVGFGHEREMNILFPKVQTYANRLYIEDEGIITCGGGVSAIDLANELISRHCGKARSIKTMRSMLLENHRKPTEMPGINYDNAKQFGSWQLQSAIRYMENNLNSPISIAELSDIINVSVAVLNQRFKHFLRVTPAKFWLQLRLQHAQHLLLNTDKQIATIADESGFFDAAHFSKRYKSIYGSTPVQTRKVHLQQLRVRPSNPTLPPAEHQKITRFHNSDGTDN